MTKTAIKNALVFDGDNISEPRTVVIEDSTISSDESGEDADAVIDGTGCTLLPGLFDCHVHIDTVDELATCASYGVTTVCDMACWPVEKYNKLHTADGPALWLGSGLPAFAVNSTHGRMLKFFGVGMDQAVESADGATKFAADRVRENVDYIKIIADVPGIDQQSLDRIQEEASARGKMTIAHAAQYVSFERGLHAGFDILTHSPMDRALDDEITAKMIAQRTIAVPTLTMMEGFSKSWVMTVIKGGWLNFQNAVDSVSAMHRAGVPILPGTDTNKNPFMGVARGESLHHELALLVRAGLTPTEALRAATSLPARYFKVWDRGRITPGLRADLVLVEGNPTEDITRTRQIRRIWSGGQEVQPAPASNGSVGCVMM